MKKALVLTFVLVFALGAAAFAAPLSGAWSTDIEFSVQTPGAPDPGDFRVASFTSVLTVDYTVGGWEFGSRSGFALGGWTSQSFSAEGALGAFEIGSALVFNPALAAFTYWNVTSEVSIAGVTFEVESLLADETDVEPNTPAMGLGGTFGVSGVAGDITLGATAFFNARPRVGGDWGRDTWPTGLMLIEETKAITFTSIDFDIAFPFACISRVAIDLDFSAVAGFDGITFSVDDIVVPGFAWLTFDIDTTFDIGVDGKAFAIVPAVTFGDWVCIRLFGRLLWAPATFAVEGLQFYGLELSHTWNGVTFTNRTEFVGAGAPGGFIPGAYWQVFTIASEAPTCCDQLLEFSVATYFLAASEELFDFGQIDIDVEMGLAPNFSINFGLVVDHADGLDDITVGFDVTW